MNYSILVPTRKRPERLSDLIASIVNTIEDKNNTEIIITYDEDDIYTMSHIDIIKQRFADRIKLDWNKKTRSYNISNDYFNWMAFNRATGKYLIAINDDTRFMIGSWDIMSFRVLEDFLKDKPDRIVYGITDDREIERKRHHNYWFSCFPLISIEAIKTLGFFFDPAFAKDGADWDIMACYQEIGRIVDLRPYLAIEHISVRSGRRDKDALDHDYLGAPPNPDTGYRRIQNAQILTTKILGCLPINSA